MPREVHASQLVACRCHGLVFAEAVSAERHEDDERAGRAAFRLRQVRA